MDTARLTPHACPLKQRDSNKDGQSKEVAQSLVEHLDSEHLTRWHETVKSTDFTYSSHKAWNLLCWLDVTQTTTQVRPDVSPENIASLLLETAKMPIPKKQRREVKWEHICNLKTSPEDSHLSSAYTKYEIDTTLSATKNRKAAGPDSIFAEFLKNLSDNTWECLARFFTSVHASSRVPTTWR